jgi:hypothetical protein
LVFIRQHSISSTVNFGMGTGCRCGRSPSSSIFSGSGGKKVARSYSAYPELFVVVDPSAFCSGGILDHPEPSSGLR